MRKKYLYLSLMLCLIGAVCVVGCGKKKKISYGDTPGVATGTIDLSGEDAEIDVENIIAPVGSDIDYTAGIEVVGAEEDDYSVKVNATNVKNDTPGTYTVGYTVTSNGKTHTSNVKVTITDDESVKKETISQNIVSSNEGETVNLNQETTQGNQTDNQVNQSGGNNTTTSPNVNNTNSENETTKNNTTTEKQTTEETTTERVLITGSNKATIKNKNLENAVIELLSGDVVTISCSTKKYIVATRTDESVVIKNGQNYSVSKLVIVFNTGEERTLETIEKKID